MSAARRLPRYGADGVSLICLVMGRGPTYGYKPVSSSKLAIKSMPHWCMEPDMDYGCGGVIGGRPGIAQTGEALFQLILATASGMRTKNEFNDLGNNESVPWRLGAVM